MSFTIKYIPLFKVDFFHFYFLNNGLTAFNSLNDEEKASRLRLYDFNSFFKVKPAAYTQRVLAGHKLVFRTSNNGFVVWCKLADNKTSTPFISLDNDLSLTFLIQSSDFNFFNYTDLELDNSSRLKYFSNRKPEGEPGDFPLIQKNSPGNTPINDEYNLSPENENRERLRLTNSEKDKLFGLIRIFMKGDTTALNVTLVNGNIRKNAITYNLTIDNRKTVWRYIFNQDQQVTGNDLEPEDNNPKILITKDPRPLTESGFVSIKLDDKELPNPDANIIVPGETNNKYFSEIYM
jgi:hypothetical protein